jgi:hypothetical protein
MMGKKSKERKREKACKKLGRENGEKESDSLGEKVWQGERV